MDNIFKNHLPTDKQNSGEDIIYLEISKKKHNHVSGDKPNNIYEYNKYQNLETVYNIKFGSLYDDDGHQSKSSFGHLSNMIENIEKIAKDAYDKMNVTIFNPIDPVEQIGCIEHYNDLFNNGISDVTVKFPSSKFGNYENSYYTQTINILNKTE